MQVNLIGCGGAGSNVVSFLSKNLSTENRSPFKDLYIDTSLNNSTEESLKDGTFFHIKSSHVDGEKLSGSGGERKTNVPHIEAGVEAFINDRKLHKNKDLNIVVFSLSGGTGSIAGPVMIKKLLSAGVNVIGLVIADSTNYQSIHNSERTIVTLNSIATKLAPLPLMYFNNIVYKKNFEVDKIKMCNRDILTVVSLLSIFTSGQNKDIDDKDMEFLFRPAQYTTLKVENGIYGISAGKCTLSEEELKAKRVLIGRTLVSNEIESAVSPLANYPLLQYKEGKTNAEVDGHVDIMLTDNLDELYNSLLKDKDNFQKTEERSTIPTLDNDDDIAL